MREVRLVLQSQEPMNSHQRALFHLARGTVSDVSINLLEQRISEHPSPAAWNDLSATILNAIDDDYDWRSLESALVAANTALTLNGAYERALFNRALTLEKLGLEELAYEVWTRFLSVTGDDVWSAEASSRRERLAAPQSDQSSIDLQKTCRAT